MSTVSRNGVSASSHDPPLPPPKLVMELVIDAIKAPASGCRSVHTARRG